jgi:hypothetical protein
MVPDYTQRYDFNYANSLFKLHLEINVQLKMLMLRPSDILKKKQVGISLYKFQRIKTVSEVSKLTLSSITLI